MSSYPPPGSGVGRRIEEAMQQIEMELRQIIAHVNDTVVPQVRRESISAMRTVADTLRKLADQIDSQSKPPTGRPEDPRT